MKIAPSSDTFINYLGDEITKIGKHISSIPYANRAEEGDIISNNGKKVINKPTFAFYKMAKEIDVDMINSPHMQGIFEYRCIVSSDVLKKLQEGAKKSDELEYRFHKYFALF